MALLIDTDGNIRDVPVPPNKFTLSDFQKIVGGFVSFIDVKDGEWAGTLVAINEEQGLAPTNFVASARAGCVVTGLALFCMPGDVQ